MSIEDWCIHHASVGGFQVVPTSPRLWGGTGFSYTLKWERRLVTHDEVLRLIIEGKPVPRVVRVAVRETFAEIERLRRRWLREEWLTSPKK
jgi:hypothetical protein